MGASKQPLNETERRVVEMVFNSGKTRLSYGAIHDIVYPEKQHQIQTQTKNDNVFRLMQRDRAKEYWNELKAIADEQTRIRVGDVVQMIADRSVDPMLRFAHLPHDATERLNQKTGEVIGYEVYPVVDYPQEIGPDLMPHVESFQYLPDSGKFRVIPRDPYDEKTRAKYTDMLAKATGSYAPERLEVTGANGGPVESVRADMSATEAAELYKRAVRGKS